MNNTNIGFFQQCQQNGTWEKICAHVSAHHLLPAQLSLPDVKLVYSAYQKIKDNQASLVYLDYLLSHFPDSSTYLRDKGLLLQKQGDWVSAQKYFERCVLLKPDSLSYQGLLATAEFFLGNYEQCVEHYNVALSDQSRQNRSWLLRLARANYLLKNFKKCQDAYSRALMLQEDLVVRSAYNEVDRILRDGGDACVSSGYYDEAFSNSEKYMRPAMESIYAPVWGAIQNLIQEYQVGSILDLGCGPGQFAEFMLLHCPAIQYVGVDFSQVAINLAKQRNVGATFIRMKLPVGDYKQLSSDFDCIVSTEVLEHIEEDIELMGTLPKGVVMIASVPNYDSFGHVRIFRDEQSVQSRYAKYFDCLNIKPISIAGNVIWLLHGRLV